MARNTKRMVLRSTCNKLTVPNYGTYVHMQQANGARLWCLGTCVTS